MSDSFSKKEFTKKRLKKRQEKAEKAENRKSANDKGKKLEEMMAYLDENGNLTSTPPDGRKKVEVDLNDIQLGAAKVADDPLSKGTVVFLSDKGYGFIQEDGTRERVFFHNDQLNEPLRESDRVSFEKEKNARGYSAVNLVKEK